MFKELTLELMRLSNRLSYHWDSLSYSEKLIIIGQLKKLLNRLVQEEYSKCSDH